MIVSILVAFAILAIIYVLAERGSLNFWQLIGFAVFYAVTQSGPSGFLRVASKIADMVRGSRKAKDG